MSSEYPRRRDDLEVSHQTEGGREYVVVKDPRSRRYARMRPPEWWLLQEMDGLKSVADLAREFESCFGAQLSPASLAAFVERLETLGFLEGERSEKTSTSLAVRQADEQGLGRLLFIKLKAIDPDH